MEERPSDRAQDKRYHHGGERSPTRTKTSLKNDPSQCQLQETQTKKTGDGRITRSAVERECTALSASDPVGIAYSANGNGHQPTLDSNWKPKQSGRAAWKPGGRVGLGYRNCIMDGKTDRTPDVRPHVCVKEPPALPNGVSVTLSPALLTNGYPNNKPSAAVGPDNDGSGSESGYTMPKKRKPLRNGGAKGMESESPVPAELMDKPTVKVETRTNKLTSTEPAVSGEPFRRNFDSKSSSAFGKKQDDRSGKARLNSIVSAKEREKEDSWTLFKPPPVFPVDNSSAKIVPKISYASKVKENLNKVAAEVPQASCVPPVVPSPAPGRPSQVPMSAMKTITSSGFANGTLCSAEGGAYSLSGTLFASTVTQESVAPPVDESGSTPDAASAQTLVAGELRKPSLFVYPLTPPSSNMQLSLPSGRQADPLPSASPAPNSDPCPGSTNQKALGDIFQNQWGLSFINDPSVGPEGGVAGAAVGQALGKGKLAVVTVQVDCPVASLTPHEACEATPQSPQLRESDKRTSPQTSHSSVLKVDPSPVRESSSGSDGQKDTAEAQNLGAIVFTSPKDLPTPVVPLRASPTSHASSPRGPVHSKGLDRRCSWGSFDLRAAVYYHTKEMEYILNLQKQDPKRVVLYFETKDGPDQ
ncbi:hypothetical protein GJAV_G00060310 [Gymnothorax javanicus]|nr:hypothetical protein GJAV_G00060310 [Gymnothorax javanicus]